MILNNIAKFGLSLSPYFALAAAWCVCAQIKSFTAVFYTSWLELVLVSPTGPCWPATMLLNGPLESLRLCLGLRLRYTVDQSMMMARKDWKRWHHYWEDIWSLILYNTSHRTLLATLLCWGFRFYAVLFFWLLGRHIRKVSKEKSMIISMANSSSITRCAFIDVYSSKCS